MKLQYCQLLFDVYPYGNPLYLLLYFSIDIHYPTLPETGILLNLEFFVYSDKNQIPHWRRKLCEIFSTVTTKFYDKIFWTFYYKKTSLILTVKLPTLREIVSNIFIGNGIHFVQIPSNSIYLLKQFMYGCMWGKNRNLLLKVSVFF